MDPSGHCIWDLCIVEISVAEVVLITAGVTAAVLLSTEDGQQAVVDTMVAALDAGEDAIKTAVAAVGSIFLAKPLTKDEEGHIGKIGQTDQFLDKHPDIAEEAEKIRNGEGGDLVYDHVKEAEDWLRGLANSIEHLTKVRHSRNAEAQEKIDEAIRQAEEYIRILKEKLYGESQ